jgi:hypothetical protein
LIGFDSPETTGRELLALIAKPAAATPDVKAPRIRLPIFGEIDPSSYSLLGLTVVMALADGFNPCAMWVLVYLISLIAGLKEREKIWWLVGTFVLLGHPLFPVYDRLVEYLPDHQLHPPPHSTYGTYRHRL